MQTLHIKCIFPEGYFTLNTVKVYVDGELVGRVSPGGTLRIDLPEHARSIAFRIMQLKHTRAVESLITGDENYLQLKWKGASSFTRFLWGLTTSAMFTETVDRQTFERDDQAVYAPKRFIAAEMDMASIVMNLGLSGYFVYLSIANSITNHALNDFLMASGLLGFITVLTMWFYRRSIQTTDAHLRMLLSTLLHASVVIWLSISTQRSTWLLGLIILTLLIKSLYNLRQTSTSTANSNAL